MHPPDASAPTREVGSGAELAEAEARDLHLLLGGHAELPRGAVVDALAQDREHLVGALAGRAHEEDVVEARLVGLVLVGEGLQIVDVPSATYENRLVLLGGAVAVSLEASYKLHATQFTNYSSYKLQATFAAPSRVSLEARCRVEATG